MTNHTRLLPLLLALTMSQACAHTLVEGTRIDDNDDNREILAMLNTVQSAMQNQDQDLLLTMVSELYFEDMGTPNPQDDYGFEHLRDVILPTAMKVAGKIVFNFTVHDIVVAADKAHADIRYNSRARLDLASGALWDSHKEFNRLQFQKEQGKWLITRGL